VNGESQEPGLLQADTPRNRADNSQQSPASSIHDSPIAIHGPPRIALVAGEASGDQLGAGLIAELRKRHPDALFVGVGGAGMRAAGLDAWHDCSALAVMGLAEVARHLPRLLRLRSTLRRRLLEWRPDVFIGIDAPDFNLGLERALKQRGIRTVHYVSPSVWAWREKRAAKIGLSADRVLCLFPMEPAIYARYGVDARYVGHPLAGTFAMEPDRLAARAALALPASGTLIALMPGSRLGEIKKLGLDFLHACVLLLRERPKLKFVAPMANAGCRKLFASQLARVAAEPDAGGLREAVLLLDGRAHEALIASDVALLASGTAALEAMLAKRPMVVAYRVARLTQAMVRGFGMMKIQRYSLPNVLHMDVRMPREQEAQERLPGSEALVPELIQGDCTPPALKGAVLAWLDDPARVETVVSRFRQLHVQLDRDASGLAADAVDELLAAARP
jgi:lipid-A-disaccharide synthase